MRGDVRVDLADQPHRLGDRRPLPVPRDEVADRVEPAAHCGEHLLVDRLERPAAGISPKFLAIMLAVRLTRLPQPATSSELVRCTNSAQVKSESLVSGPAAQMK